MKCLYANTFRTRNKHDELEICAQLQGYSLTGVMEMWWDGSHNWSSAQEGYRVFGKEGMGR